MSLEIKVERKKDYAYTVNLKGSLDTDTYQELESDLKEIIDEKVKVIVLDMAGLTYISSIGIRVVMWTKKALKEKNAGFAMVNLQPQIEKVFDVMKILPMFDIFNNMAEADEYIDQMIKDEVSKQQGA